MRDPSTGAISHTAAVTGTTGLPITRSWNVSTSTSMVKGISSDGPATLEFIADNGGFLKTGGVFDYAVTMPGNGSAHGAATGDSQFIGLDSGFTITQNFVFDARSDITTVEVIDAHYASGNPDVDLDFVLYGSAVSAVSEPVSPGTMLGGLAALGCIGRRRRAA